MSSTNVISSKRSIRLDVFDYSITKNDRIFRYIDLTNVNSSNKDLQYKFNNLKSYDYINSMDFDKQSTFTYHLVDNFKAMICYTSLSKIVLCIKLSDYTLMDKKVDNFKVFFNHELNVFTLDAIFQHNTLISLNINKNIFLNNKGEDLIHFNIRKNALPKQYIASGIHHLNNFFNLIPLKTGGMLLVEKHLDQNHVPCKYTLHEHDIVESHKRSFWGYLKGAVDDSEEIFIKSVSILPDNKILTVNNQLKAQLYRLDVDGLGHVTSELTLLDTVDLSLLEFFQDKAFRDFDNDLSMDFKIVHSPDYTKFAIYYINHQGMSGYVLLNYDIQSEDVVSLNQRFSYISDLEAPSIKSHNSSHYHLNHFKMTNNMEIFSVYKTDSFSTASGEGSIEHVVMKHSDKKWRDVYSSKSGDDFEDATDDIDVCLHIANTFNLPKTKVINDLKVHDLRDYVAEASQNMEKFSSNPCSIAFNASSIYLPNIEYAYSGFNAGLLNTYFVPKFSAPIIDESGFLRSLNDLFYHVDFAKRPFLTYNMVRECLKDNADMDSEAIKESVFKNIDKTLFLDISNKIQIPDCVATIKKLIDYTVDLDVTSKYGNTVQEQQVLLEYVAYKNYELMVLYMKILLFFTSAEVKNAELLETLSSLAVLLRKRFKFEQCFKFNKNIIFDIFVEDSPSLNLHSEQNLVITSEFILTNIVIDKYTEWTDKYQLAFLAKDKFTKEDLKLFTEYIQRYDVNDKIQNIVYLKLNNYEKLYETAVFDLGSMDLSEEVDEYDEVTKSLLMAPNNYEYLITLLSIFSKNAEQKELSHKLSQLINDHYSATDAFDANTWGFYKSYVPLLAQDEKFDEVIATMNTLTNVKNEDLLQQIRQFIDQFGRKYLKAVIRFNTLNRNTEEIMPFAQFYMIKMIAFEMIMNDAKTTDIVVMDYIKLLLSYEDTQQALNFLYALIINDDDYAMKHQYKVTMKAVLSTLPQDERYVVDEEGNVLGMDILASI